MKIRVISDLHLDHYKNSNKLWSYLCRLVPDIDQRKKIEYNAPQESKDLQEPKNLEESENPEELKDLEAPENPKEPEVVDEILILAGDLGQPISSKGKVNQA